MTRCVKRREEGENMVNLDKLKGKFVEKKRPMQMLR